MSVSVCLRTSEGVCLCVHVNVCDGVGALKSHFPWLAMSLPLVTYHGVSSPPNSHVPWALFCRMAS